MIGSDREVETETPYGSLRQKNIPLTLRRYSTSPTVVRATPALYCRDQRNPFAQTAALKGKPQVTTRKLRPFAEILILVGSLNDEQKADLLDVLRGKQPKKERKPKKAEKTEKAEKSAKAEMCVTCGNEKSHADHQESSDAYHIFRTSVKSKAGT